MNETKLDSKFKLVIPGDKIYRKDRNSAGGGVALLIKNNLKCDVLNVEFKVMESVPIKIKTIIEEIKIICLYLPPNKKFSKHDLSHRTDEEQMYFYG